MDDDATHRTAARQFSRPFLNTRQAAHYLGLSARHLERMRRRRTGPRFRRHGRFVFYHIDDIEAWSRATAEAERDND
jgi:predicted DNA-binding transcriptional regulator AlpA